MNPRVSVSLLLALSAAAARGGPVSFNRDIRPIMSNTCFHCHGPDANSRKAGLRLDVRDAALAPAKSGEIPIVPGDPDKSEVIRRLFTAEEDDLMPPPEEHKPLTAEQKETMRRWVAEGAVYEAHWAYTPLRRPEPPVVKEGVAAANDIDGFLLAAMDARGVRPSGHANPRELLRRLSLDLTGLPPEPADVEAFAADPGPAAWERAVDRLLASPHFGERMTVYWLDLARYADTAGYHGDQNLRIFPYRDYVIDSFNRNKPFDIFTREQLAGDLLPNPGEEQLIATGFNRLNMMTREGGAQPKEYLAKYAADRVRTVGNAWLGSTFGCAECHDHKFDPIKARDFYSMQAFFADVKQWGVYADYGYTPEPELKGVNNDSPFPPEARVENRWLRQADARAQAEIRALSADAAARRNASPEKSAAFAEWKKSTADFLSRNPKGWLMLTAVEKPAPPPREKEDAEKAKKKDGLELSYDPGPGAIAAVSMTLMPKAGGTVLADGAREAGSMAISFRLKRAGSDEEKGLAVEFADADRKTDRHANGVDIPGIASGWKIDSAAPDQPHTGVWILKEPLTPAAGDILTVTIKGPKPFSPGVAVSPVAPADFADGVWMGRVATAFHTPGPDAASVLTEAWLSAGGGEPADVARLRDIRARQRSYTGGHTWTMVTQAVAPYPIRILPRGNFLDESGPVVPPATPEFLPGPAAPESGRLNRLDLAAWITSSENPLTARTFANRMWRLLFGTGLSAAVDDLGAQGEPPTHPELLDWLAVEFRDSGWNVKHLMKVIVMSSAYQRDSNIRQDLAEIDPANRLLAAQNPRRLDAEFVRDNALSIAGLLNPDIGGPAVMPYQPPGYYVNLQFPDRDYTASPAPDQWRRGVYSHWQRTFLQPMLANFDAPMRDECTAARTVSNTPQQALTLLNDPTFAEAARVWATRLLAGPEKDDGARLDAAARRALARPFTAKERESLTRFLAEQREHYRATPDDASKVIRAGTAPPPDTKDPAELAAWVSVCRVILNLHETITRY